MNIKDLQKEIHAYVKEKGWWDKPRTVGALIALCHSELSEALECLRDDTPVDIIFRDNATGKPEGFAIELADTVIRILDMAEFYGIDYSRWMEPTFEELIEKADLYASILEIKEGLCLPDLITVAHSQLSKAFATGYVGLDHLYASNCIAVIAVMSKRFEIPLIQAIKVKMEYNLTRPYRHGGKAL